MPLLDLLSAVASSVKEAGIIPDVIKEKTPFNPQALLVVNWATGKEAILGNTLTTIDTADEPAVSFTPMQTFDSADEVGYTLVMTDPDAPSRRDPKMGEWRHWVVTGIKPPGTSALEAGDMSARFTKAATTPYHPPAPPPGTGPHRYVFLLYQEPSPDFSIAPDAPEHKNGARDRAKWSAQSFAQRYGLKLVGVNYFYVRGAE
ncbi:phosphatidylethanolamine-binding protein [Phlebopus sp. FC_14]|nr:phosphatidylethanolamine-binding protein [Phlebopus sp. FC_14]